MSTEKETALVVIEPTTALAVFTNAEKVDPILAAIRKIVAERARLAEDARVKAEAERRAADEANRTRIHLEIRDFLVSEGLPLSNASAGVSLLSTGSIPHVSVRY